MPRDPYDVLGVNPEDPNTVIESAYRELVKETHPDLGGDANEFAKVRDAYSAIKNTNSDMNGGGESHGYEGSDGDGDDSEFLGAILGVILGESDPAETISSVGDPEKGISVEGDIFSVRLIGIQLHTDVSSLIGEYHELDGGDHRTLAFFEIYNKQDDVNVWRSKETIYVDDEGFSYGVEKPYIKDEKLGPRWQTHSVELTSKSRSYFIEMVDEMPSHTTLHKIVHRQDGYAEGRLSGVVEHQERYEFIIDNLDDDLIALPDSTV